MTDTPEHMIDTLVAREGGYDSVTDDPTDKGRLTRAGITQRSADTFKLGDVRNLTHGQIYQFYFDQYWTAPGFARIGALSMPIAEKLFDIKVNGGMPGVWLQRVLNVCNRQGTDFPDLVVDGVIGQGTYNALAALIKFRGQAATESVVVFMLGAFQGVRYVELAEKDPTQEKYEWGWLSQRALYGVTA